MRYIKFRHQESHSGSDTTISLGRADNHIIDHCSFSHHSPSKSTVSIATKNNSDVEDFTNGTFSNNLLGNNTLGFIAGESTPSSPDTNGYFTVIRNGYYNISHRVPLKGGSAIKVDVVNNIVHNWSARTIRMDGWEYKLNHFENYYQAGTNTSNQLKWTSYLSNTGNPQIYTTDNFLEDDPRGNYSKPAGFDTDESVAWTQFQDNFVPLPSSYFTDVQHSINGRAFTIYQNAQLKDSILPEIGACKYMDNNGNAVFSRDVYDEEYVNGIISNSDSTRDTNLVLPIQTSSNTRPGNFYVSNDHIPEVWFSANVPDGEDHNDIAPSGYTWLEEYMNQVDNAESIGAESVTLSPSTDEITVEATLQLNVTFTPANTTNQSGTYFSNNADVATVDENGLVTAVGQGVAIITFTSTDGGFTDTSQITVFNEALQASAGNDQSICEGDVTSLTATGGTNYLWSTGETTATIEVNPSVTTTYSVTVSNDNGQEDTASIVVTVNEMPELTISNNITIAEGESTMITVSGASSYIWNTGGTVEAFEASPTETTTYSVIGFNGNCAVEAEVTVSVYKANAGVDERVCENDDYEVLLTANQGDSYLWNTGETTQSITVSPLSTTQYTVAVTSGNLTDDDDVTVYVDPNPNVVIANGDNVDILDGDFITLSASGANTYEWSNSATQPNVAVSPSQTTTYEVKGYINDCYDEKAITVNVFQPTIANAGPNVSICIDETATLTANGGNEYLWSTGETTQTIEVAPTVTTDYFVTVFNALDFDEAAVTVEVDLNCDEEAVIPGEEPLGFGMQIYPNPASNYVNVEISGVFDTSKIEVYDITGKRIIKKEVLNENEDSSISHRLNVSQLQDGIYILKLIGCLLYTSPSPRD